LTRRRGYADGGKVDQPPAAPWFQRAIGADALAKGFARKVEDAASGKKPDAPPAAGKSRGGKITSTAGKPIGKDDGMIPAQRGEYVVKKSSTAKYGPAKMAAVNKGTARISTTKRGKQ